MHLLDVRIHPNNKYEKKFLNLKKEINIIQKKNIF